MKLFDALHETLTSLVKPGTAHDPVEMRRLYRVQCDLPVVAMLSEKNANYGRLVNLTSRGMKVRLERKLKTGPLYRVIVSAHPDRSGPRKGPPSVTLTANALWCRRSTVIKSHYDVGFLFTSCGMKTEDVILFFREQLDVPVATGPQKRRTARIHRTFEVVMSHPEAKVLSGVVRDLSVEGIQWQADLPLDVNSRVHLRLALEDHGYLETEALVKWCRPDAAGNICFEIGASFIAMTETNRTMLTRVIQRHLKKDPE